MALAIKEAGHNDLTRSAADFLAGTDQDVTEENTDTFFESQYDDLFKTLLGSKFVGNSSPRVTARTSW